MSCLRPCRAVPAGLAWGLAASVFGAGPVGEQGIVAGVLKATLTLTADDLKAVPPARFARVSSRSSQRAISAAAHAARAGAFGARRGGVNG